MYGCNCLLELYMLLSLPPKDQLDILYSVPTIYCGAAPMMHIRSPLKKAGPESGTIFGSQIQATKSEAPLWGLTFWGSDSDTENGIEICSEITYCYETLLQPLRCNHTPFKASYPHILTHVCHIPTMLAR